MEMATAFTDAWHWQPDPADRPDGRDPSNPQWLLVSALWLLAAWTPESAPGWASTLVLGKTGDPRAEPWPAPPERLAALAGLPKVSDAVQYTGTTSRDDRSVPPEELVSLITEAAHVQDARRMSLVRYLVDEAAGQYGDLLRLATTDDDPALHLLHRDYNGSTVRITLEPAAAVRQPPIIADDGADGALRTRIACLATLLSDHLMVNNNNPVDFRFRIGRLPESETGDDSLAAAARYWSATREDAEEYADEEPTFRPTTFPELRASLYNTAARLSRIDLWDGSWDDIDEMPEIPSDHLVPHLVDDLVDVIEQRLDGALVTVNGYLPTEWPPTDPTEDDETEYTYVLFVRGNEVGVLDIDHSC
ncbi:hypothetical protein [Actinomadura sp. WMMA1423]|uniref:hypothetical protein n=1 Tax=Actinomadura sp. WMMA1423 TaxID=2591108 RepID=UPI0011473993|nr:hypothetical protein [Actinomadura sp. WMMA1423]